MDCRCEHAQMPVIVGTAGWSIPSAEAGQFGDGMSALERYATRLNGVEINSSFYRPHRPSTWARWRDAVPADFKFSVKLPKAVSHDARLVDCADVLARFLDEVHGLDGKLAVLLLQLPPSLAFQATVVEDFLSLLTAATFASVACEPRHASWFEPEVDALLDRLRVTRVAADPPRDPASARPGGRRDLAYWRWHGSPIIYRSSYDAERLTALAQSIREDGAAETWCVFDNTAASAAIGNALTLDVLTRS